MEHSWLGSWLSSKWTWTAWMNPTSATNNTQSRDETLMNARRRGVSSIRSKINTPRLESFRNCLEIERYRRIKVWDAPAQPSVAWRPGIFLEAEEFAQAFGLGPADRNLGLLFVVHAELVGALEPGDYFLNAVDVDQKGAVGAPE